MDIVLAALISGLSCAGASALVTAAACMRRCLTREGS